MCLLPLSEQNNPQITLKPRLLFCLFLLGATPMLRSYSALHSGIIPAVLSGPDGVPEIEPGWLQAVQEPCALCYLSSPTTLQSRF